jgi:hypothetical protein
VIRILLKSHSINYRDREGPLAARHTNWLPNQPHQRALGRASWLLCDLGCALPSLGLCMHWVRLCLKSPGHLKSFSFQPMGWGVAVGWA